MNTKEYVWRFFNSTLRILAQKDCSTIDFQDMCILLKNYANVYDNRSLKNYIDCMINNKWVIGDNSENVYNPHGLITNPESPAYQKSNNMLILYKYTKFIIDKNAQFDNTNPEDILNQIIDRNKPTEKKIAPTSNKEE